MRLSQGCWQTLKETPSDMISVVKIKKEELLSPVKAKLQELGKWP